MAEVVGVDEIVEVAVVEIDDVAVEECDVVAVEEWDVVAVVVTVGTTTRSGFRAIRRRASGGLRAETRGRSLGSLMLPLNWKGCLAADGVKP